MVSSFVVGETMTCRGKMRQELNNGAQIRCSGNHREGREGCGLFLVHPTFSFSCISSHPGEGGGWRPLPGFIHSRPRPPHTCWAGGWGAAGRSAFGFSIYRMWVEDDV